ncbi:MAG: TCR/Tet family MFS transporter [Rhizobiales bacterium]|nr:TCR/Tet family MFS transporter [Hyphomicrobiales bacterium]NRB14564.1 TCR/Tet family MFS transporter [Hyphomicrobiales bacterium]
MTQSRKHLYFILFIVLLDVVGLGIIIPIFPQLLMELGGTSLSQSAIIGGYLVFVYAVMQFLFAPVMGALSDQFGRRPVILISVFVFMLDYILLANAPNIWWLAIGRVIAGIAGSSITTAHAYVTDISKKANRAKYFGLLGAAMGLGFILGPALGGFLGDYGVRVPFWFSAIVLGITFVIGYFVLPESLPIEKRRKFEWSRANPIGALIQMSKYKWVIGLMAVMFLMEMAGQVYPTTWTFFTIERFDWSIKEVGGSLALFGALMVIVQGGLIGPIIKKFGNVTTVFIGLVASTVTFVVVGFVTEAWMLYSFMPIMALGGIAGVGVRTMLSHQVPDNAQGELQGALTSASSIVAFISPLMMTQIFGYFSSKDAYIYLPGAAFLAAAVLSLIGLFVFISASRAPDEIHIVAEGEA